MTLVAELTSLPAFKTGDLEDTVLTLSSITGLQEPEPGWVLCNGATLPAGSKYDALRTLLGTSVLPSLIDGVVAVMKGAGYTVIGATDGAVTVVLGLAHITNHAHSYTNYTIHPNVGAGNGTVTFGNPGGDGWEDASGYSLSGAGSGGAHNNMPPYLVVEGTLIKL